MLRSQEKVVIGLEVLITCGVLIDIVIKYYLVGKVSPILQYFAI